MGVWGKGDAYPLIGDKACLLNDDEIWEVWWLYSSSYGLKYRLIPWPSRNMDRMIESWQRDLVPVPPERLILDQIALATEPETIVGHH